jgi:hypothetical protein
MEIEAEAKKQQAIRQADRKTRETDERVIGSFTSVKDSLRDAKHPKGWICLSAIVMSRIQEKGGHVLDDDQSVVTLNSIARACTDQAVACVFLFCFCLGVRTTRQPGGAHFTSIVHEPKDKKCITTLGCNWGPHSVTLVWFRQTGPDSSRERVVRVLHNAAMLTLGGGGPSRTIAKLFKVSLHPSPFSDFIRTTEDQGPVDDGGAGRRTGCRHAVPGGPRRRRPAPPESVLSQWGGGTGSGARLQDVFLKYASQLPQSPTTTDYPSALEAWKAATTTDAQWDTSCVRLRRRDCLTGLCRLLRATDEETRGVSVGQIVGLLRGPQCEPPSEQFIDSLLATLQVPDRDTMCVFVYRAAPSSCRTSTRRACSSPSCARSCSVGVCSHLAPINGRLLCLDTVLTTHHTLTFPLSVNHSHPVEQRQTTNGIVFCCHRLCSLCSRLL